MAVSIERDVRGKKPLSLQKDHTDNVADILEALANMVSSPAGLAKVVCSRNGALLDLTGLMGSIAGRPSSFASFSSTKRAYCICSNRRKAGSPGTRPNFHRKCKRDSRADFEQATS
jgi:hypothetical protein